MWVRAFHPQYRTKKYKLFVKRYKEFRTKDTVEICDAHHEEIHELYGPEIMRFVKKIGYKPVRRWTWAEAEKLMKHLRVYCGEWLKKETPGRPLKKFAR